MTATLVEMREIEKKKRQNCGRAVGAVAAGYVTG